MLQLVHVVQHFWRKIPSITFLGVDCGLGLEVISVPSCCYASWCLFFHGFGARLGVRLVVYVVHATEVDVIAVL